jgi:hypothetical protein
LPDYMVQQPRRAIFHFIVHQSTSCGSQ